MTAMIDSDISYHTLPNGMRAIHIHSAGTLVGYCGVAIRVGSRDEDETTHGLAHFVEHTIFKGTVRRSSWHIINRMEAVGGELNAYTTKEETVIYSAFPAGNLIRATELISDLIVNSQFPERELDKEREVVADEIASYLDSPSEAVYDDFEDMIFAGTALGHNILGTEEELMTFTSTTCREYLRKWYVASNMVAFYDGPDSPGQVFRTFERYFSAVPQTPTASHRSPIAQTVPTSFTHFSHHKEIDSHQAHTIIGERLAGMFSTDRYPIALATNIIGGPGMNSLLNVALRERRGLVYTVEASATLFSDCGLMCVYYGCDPDDNDRCLKLVRGQIARLADKQLTQRQLTQAKVQYLGQLTVSSENRESRALSAARATLFRGAATPLKQTTEAIRAVSGDDIRRISTILAEAPSLTLGPKINK